MKHNKTFYVVVERKERKYRQNYRQWLLDNKLGLADIILKRLGLNNNFLEM